MIMYDSHDNMRRHISLTQFIHNYVLVLIYTCIQTILNQQYWGTMNTIWTFVSAFSEIYTQIHIKILNIAMITVSKNQTKAQLYSILRLNTISNLTLLQANYESLMRMTSQVSTSYHDLTVEFIIQRLHHNSKCIFITNLMGTKFRNTTWILFKEKIVKVCSEHGEWMTVQDLNKTMMCQRHHSRIWSL